MSLKRNDSWSDRYDAGMKSFLDSFHLYLWRTLESPGIRYLAGSAPAAEAMSRELLKEGYIVKVLHAGTGVEYEMRGDALLPVRTAPLLA